MKLFYSPGACSLAVHIALEEAELPCSLEKVDRAHKTSELLSLNPLGTVPTLAKDDGSGMGEAVALLQWVADQKPEVDLAPRNGSWARDKLRETLNFLSTEIHKSFGPFFSVDTYGFDALGREVFLKKSQEILFRRLGILNERLSDQPFLLGAHYSVADMYLFVMLNWTKILKMDISQFQNLQNFTSRVFNRPAVQKAMKAAGILK